MSDNRGPEVAVETGAIAFAAGDWCDAVNSIGAAIQWGAAAGRSKQLSPRPRT
jgi:hypothetical protein